jgi:hypothetical protein
MSRILDAHGFLTFFHFRWLSYILRFFSLRNVKTQVSENQTVYKKYTKKLIQKNLRIPVHTYVYYDMDFIYLFLFLFIETSVYS